MILYEDNQSAICLAKNPKDHRKTKHIDIKIHFVRDLINSGKIEINYCPSENMVADIFTKPLSFSKFVNLRKMLCFTEHSC